LQLFYIFANVVDNSLFELSILLQANSEANVVRDVVGPPLYKDDVSIQQTGAWCECGGEMTTFQATPSSSYGQPIEMPEVTSLISCLVQGQVVADEEFLEMKDLNDPDSIDWKTDGISNNDHIPVTDGFDPDDYFDAQMYLADAMGPGHGITQYSCWDGFGDDESHSHASHITTDLWTQDQVFNMSTAVETNQFLNLPPPASSGA